MKKTTKRLLAAVLCLVMVLGALPLTALADTPTTDVVYGFYNEDGEWTQDASSNGTAQKDEEGYVTLTKTATQNSDGTYTVNLGVELKMKTEPSATALVIDLSNSMDNCAYCGKEKQSGNTVDKNKCTCSTTSTLTYKEIYSQSYGWDDPVIRRDGEYYINNDGTYQRVYHCSEGHWVGPVNVSYDCWFTVENHNAHSSSNRVTPKNSVYDYNLNHRQFYYAVGQTSSTGKFVSRLDKAKEAAESFLKIYSGLEFNSDGSLKTTTDQKLGRYISIVQFGTSARVKTINSSEWVDVSNPSNYTLVVNAIKGLATKFALGASGGGNDSGGTNLDAGLRKAQELMSWDSPKTPATAMLSTSNKNVVVLSDGTPTYYVKTNNYGSASNQKADYNEGCPKSIDATEVTAGNLKAGTETVAGSTVYTICFGQDVSDSKCWNKKTDRDGNAQNCEDNNVLHDDTTKTVGDFLKNVATDAQHFYDATDTERLMSAFAKVAENVVKGLNSGTVLDTLPTGVTVSGSGDFTDSQMNWTLDPTKVTPTTGEDGFKHYVYTESYVVSVTANDDNTVDVGGESYVLLNGTTTFTGGGHTYGFPIPAVHVEAAPTTAAVTINKTFAGLDNDAELPAPQITISKQTDDGTYETGTSYNLSGNATDGYTFGSGIALEAGTYKLTESNYTVDGYTWTGSLSGGTAVMGKTDEWTFEITEHDFESGKTLTLANNYALGTVTVTFTVVGGTWSGKTGNDATSFDVELNYGDTLDGHIPTGIPDASYYGSGTWTDDTPTATTTVTANVEYTLTYARRGEITITGDSDSKTYNGGAQEITTYTTNGLPSGYTLSGLTYSAKGTNVGEYGGEFSGTPSIISEDGITDITDQYTITTTPGTLTITKKDVTITVANAEKDFGEADPTFTGTVTGLVNDGDLGTINYKRTSTSEAVGTYENDLTAAYTENGNYNVTVVNGDFEIETATSNATLTATGGEWTYDGTAHTPTVTLSDNTYTVYYKVGEGEWTTTAPSVTNVNEGTVTVSVKATKTGYADLTCDDVTLQVTARPITITVSDASKTFGQSDPEFTGSITSGSLVAADDLGTINYYRTNTTVNDVGVYTDVLDATYTANTNYTVTVVNGDFKIKAALAPELTVEKHLYLINGVSKVPGDQSAFHGTGDESVHDVSVGDKLVWCIRVTNSGYAEGKITLSDILNGSPLTKVYGDLDSNNACTDEITEWPQTVPACEGNDGNRYDDYYVEYTVTEDDIGKVLVNKVVMNDEDGDKIDDESEGVPVGGLTVTKDVTSVGTVYDVVIDGEVNPSLNTKAAAAPTTAKVGETITWTITVKNYYSTEQKFTLTDTLVDGDGNSITGVTVTAPAGVTAVDGKYTINGATEKNADDGSIVPVVLEFTATYKVKQSDAGKTLFNNVKVEREGGTSTEDKAPGVKVEDKPNTPSYNPNYNAGVQLEKGEHFNYVIGYSDGTVRPEGNITRAEVATIFFRLLTDESRKTYLTEYNTFTDVEKSMWHNVAISTLARAGVLNGYNDGSFRPDNNITRAEMAAIISRFAELEGSTRISFTDIKGHWAEKSILLAASNGWINGYNDGSFRPDQNITRAETFAMINRVLERKVEHVNDLVSDMNTWVDNMDTTQWYYFDVQEATNYHSYERKYTNTKAEKWIKKLTDIDWTVYQY